MLISLFYKLVCFAQVQNLYVFAIILGGFFTKKNIVLFYAKIEQEFHIKKG